jgi:hypothetical protein
MRWRGIAEGACYGIAIGLAVAAFYIFLQILVH